MNDELMFGDYVEIEQKRYGVENEDFIYKVITTGLRSNAWVDVPVQTPPVEALHDDMEDVVNCVCCGVSEICVRKYRVADVKICNPNPTALRAQLAEAQAEIKRLAEEIVKYGERVESWLYKGNDEPMWYEDFMYFVHDIERRLHP